MGRFLCVVLCNLCDRLGLFIVCDSSSVFIMVDSRVSVCLWCLVGLVVGIWFCRVVVRF